MYVPVHNRVDDQARINAFIHAYGFATIVTQNADRLWASHLPVLFDESSNTLRSHMARPNEQWRHLDSAKEILCIFHGPHAYISPSWYVHQHTVPTWNYGAVHVYGRPSVIDDRDALKQIVIDTTEKYEGLMPQPWRLPLSDQEFEAMLKGIVGFTIAITRVEAKFKLGQNKTAEDREGTVRGLTATNHLPSMELAEFTRAQLGM